MMIFFFFCIIVASISALCLLFNNEKSGNKKTIFYNPAPKTHEHFFTFLNNDSEEALIIIHFPSRHKEFFRNIMIAVKERILTDGYFSNINNNIPSLPMEIKDGYVVFSKNWKDDADESIFLNFIIPSKYNDYVQQIFEEEFIEQDLIKAKAKKINEEQIEIVAESSEVPKNDIQILEPETTKLSEEDISFLIADAEIITEEPSTTEELATEDSPSEEIENVQTETVTEEIITPEIEVTEVDETINNESEIQEDITSDVTDVADFSTNTSSNETELKETFEEIPEEVQFEIINDQETSEEQPEETSETTSEVIPIESEQKQQKTSTIEEPVAEDTETTSTDVNDQKVQVLAFKYSIEYAVSKGCKFDFQGKFEKKVFNGNEIALTKMKQPKAFFDSSNPTEIETFLKCIEQKPIIFLLAGFTYEKVLETLKQNKVFMPISFKDQVILFNHKEEIIPGLPIGVYVLEYPD